MDHVHGHLGLAHLARDLEGLVRGPVGDLALPVAEAPERRQVPLSRDVGVLGEDLLQVAEDQVVVEEVVLDGDLEVGGVQAPDPGRDAARVIEVDAVAPGAHEERDVLVAARSADAQGLEHVEVDRLADLVEPQELLPHAVDGLVRPQGEALRRDRARVPRAAADARVVGVPLGEGVLLAAPDGAELATARGGDRDRERVEPHLDAEPLGPVEHPLWLRARLGPTGAFEAPHHHGRLVGGHRLPLGVAHAQDRGAHRVDAEPAAALLPLRQLAGGAVRSGVRRPACQVLLEEGRRLEQQAAGIGLENPRLLHEAAHDLAALEQARVQAIDDGGVGHVRSRLPTQAGRRSVPPPGTPSARSEPRATLPQKRPRRQRIPSPARNQRPSRERVAISRAVPRARRPASGRTAARGPAR